MLELIHDTHSAYNTIVRQIVSKVVCIYTRITNQNLEDPASLHILKKYSHHLYLQITMYKHWLQDIKIVAVDKLLLIASKIIKQNQRMREREAEKDKVS